MNHPLNIDEAAAKVNEFHRAFNLRVKDSPQANLNKDLTILRHILLAEENNEYLQAAADNDIVEIADALGDCLYVLFGTIISHGLQHKISEVFLEIHKSNMSKLDKEGKAIYREDGKVIKSALYEAPDIKNVLSDSI